MQQSTEILVLMPLPWHLQAQKSRSMKNQHPVPLLQIMWLTVDTLYHALTTTDASVATLYPPDLQEIQTPPNYPPKLFPSCTTLLKITSDKQQKTSSASYPENTILSNIYIWNSTPQRIYTGGPNTLTGIQSTTTTGRYNFTFLINIIPKGKKIAYANLICDMHLSKSESRRVRLTVRGKRLNYSVDPSSP